MSVAVAATVGGSLREGAAVPLAITRGFAAVPAGQLHLAEAGDGPPVLLLHQTPRSWAEYVGVLPRLAERGWRAIALDTPGFGDSYRPGPGSIEGYARAALDALDALAIDRTHVAGHHTGGVIAIEIAAAAPERVDRLVLSSTPWVDAAARRARAERPPIDAVEPRLDGAHLAELWQRRAAFYPPQRPDLLTAFVLDALKAADPEEGHLAVGRYRMEDRLPLVTAPTLLVGAPDDPFAYPHLPELAQRLADSRIVEIAGGMVPLPDQLPEEFTAAVADFLEERR